MEGHLRRQSSDNDINQTDSYGPYNNCLIENSHKHLPIVENDLKKNPKYKIQC